MKIGIVGTGNVGSTIAFLLSMHGIADEIVMINKTAERAYAEACDISHALINFSNCAVKSSDFSGLTNADIVILSCGNSRKRSGKDRLELLEENIHIYCEIIPEILKFNKKAIFIIVTNPVDVLSYVTFKLSKLPQEKIIGSGTILDSSRFVTVLSQYLNVAPKNIHADVFGEHGNSQVPIWSGVKVFGKSIELFAKEMNIDISNDVKFNLSQRTKFAADEIISGKQSTYYGIAGSVAIICRSIKDNLKVPINVSFFHKNFQSAGDVFLSTPAVVRRNGISRIEHYKLSKEEDASLDQSACIIANSIKTAEKFLQNL